MTTSGIKWSDDVSFPEGGEVRAGDKIVGLRNNQNYKFSFPSDGIKDENGNFLIKWDTVGGNATNFLMFKNGQSGIPTKITAEGSDGDIDIDIDLKGGGALSVNGLFTVNGSTKINSIIDDDTMSGASNANVPTSESVVAYIANLTPVAAGLDTQVQYNNAGILAGDSGFTTDGAGTLSITTQLSVSNIRFNGNTISSTNLNGDITIQPDGTGTVRSNGFFNLNSSVPIDAVINDSTMATATISNIPTSQSVVDFVNAKPTNAGGSNTQIQYNNSGVLGGDSGFTTNGAGNVALTGLLSVDNLRLDANTLSSTNVNGNIDLTPNGSGNVIIDGVNWGGLTNGQLFIGNAGNVPTGAALTAGNGMSVVNGAGAITLNVRGGGYDWTEVTGLTTQMAVNKGYIANNAAVVTLTLPLTSNVGDTLRVQGKGAGKWIIAQNAGQSMHFKNLSTTTGITGSINAKNQYDGIELICITANTMWASTAETDLDAM